MLPAILALGGSVLSAKQAQDERKSNRLGSDRDALLAANQTAYSGFTGGPAGHLAEQQHDPSVMGNALAGGVVGFSQGQAYNQAQSQDKMNNAYTDYLRSKTPPAPSVGQPVPDRAGGITAYSRDYLTRA